MKLTQKTKLMLAIALSAVVILVGGIILVNYNSPIEKFKRLMEKDDYVSALNLYDTKLAGGEDSHRAVGFIRNEMDVILEEFKAGEREYQTVASELDAFEAIPELEAEVKEIRPEIERFQNSFLAYAAAEEFFAQGDYENAISSYKKVIAEDGNFEAAQEKLEKSVQNYRNEVVKTTDELVEKEQYSDAVELLSSAMAVIPDDTTLQQKWNTVCAKQEEHETQLRLEQIASLLEQENYREAVMAGMKANKEYPDNTDISKKLQDATEKYIEEVTQKVNEQIREDNLTEAQQLANELRSVLPDNTVYEELSEKIEQYYPVSLLDLESFQEESYELIEETVNWVVGGHFDNMGNTDYQGMVYTVGITGAGGRNGTHEEAYLEYTYLIDGKYNEFSGILATERRSKNETWVGSYARVVVYGDGAKLFTSSEIRGGVKPIDFSVDITNVNELKIRIEAAGCLQFGLLDTTLRKTEVE